MKLASKKVESAVEVLNTSFDHFLVLKYNFPLDAMLCIPLLHQALELLLVELHPNLSGRDLKMVQLIQHHDRWDPKEMETAHWLRKRRNKIQHEGEIDWEYKPEIVVKLRSVYLLIGGLLEEVGHPIGKFSIFKRCILADRSPPWYALADELSATAIRYTDIDEEIALDVANAAFDVGLRGFAASWGIEEADSLSISELFEEMWKHDEDNAHPHYCDERITDDRDRYKDLGESPDTVLRPPLAFHSITSRPYRPIPESVKYYAQEIREIILSYLERFPLLELESFFRENWNQLVDEMKEAAPNVDVPKTRDELWDYEDHFCNLEVSVPFDDPNAPFLMGGIVPSSVWKGDHLERFIEILEERYGELPEGLAF